MKHPLILLCLIFLSGPLLAQNVYTIKADSVKLTGCDSTELIIENHTQNVPGFLFNTGNGRTIFKRGVTKINDSTYLIGSDTLKVPFKYWSLTGNSNINAATQFMGTTDSNAVVFRSKNIEQMRIAANGNVGIGTNSPSVKFHSNGNFYFTELNSLLPGKASLLNTPINGDGRWGLQYTTSAYTTKYWLAQFRDYFLGLGSGATAVNIGISGVTAPLVLSDQGAHAAVFIIGSGAGPNNVSRLRMRMSNINEITTGAAYPSGVNYYQMETEILTPIVATNTGVLAIRAPLFIGGRYLKFNTGNTSTEAMRIDSLGNVGIHTSSPTAQLHTTGTVRFAGLTEDSTKSRVLVSDANGNLYYRSASSLAANDIFRSSLAVNGTITAQKLRLNQIGWPDYVFEDNYHLSSLTELDQFIRQNKHLPEVPSAAEVEKKGLDVGNNQAALLKKIEELTLYLIDQEKKLKIQDEEIKMLKEKDKQLDQQNKELESLKHEMAELRTMIKN